MEDNGIGFPQEHADRIFDTFTRLNQRGTFQELVWDYRFAKESSKSIKAPSEQLEMKGRSDVYHCTAQNVRGWFQLSVKPAGKSVSTNVESCKQRHLTEGFDSTIPPFSDILEE